MTINFKIHEISRDARKLAQTLMLKKNTSIIPSLIKITKNFQQFIYYFLIFNFFYPCSNNSEKNKLVSSSTC